MDKELKKLGFGPSGNLAVIELGGERYFSTAETARVLGLCAASFYTLKRNYELAGKRIGRRKYYSEKELSEILFEKRGKKCI